MTLDQAGFDKEMQAQKERARNAAATETGDWTVVNEGDPEFVGYDNTSCETAILRYRKVKQKKANSIRLSSPRPRSMPKWEDRSATEAL